MRCQIARLDKLQESWTEKAELALRKEREDLAKGALVEKQKAADLADSLKAEIEALDDAMRASEADIAKLQGKLREARIRQNAIRAGSESANQRARMREMNAGPKVDEAFSRFDVLERRVDDAEGRADALSLGAPPRTLEEEIAELRNEEKVIGRARGDEGRRRTKTTPPPPHPQPPLPTPTTDPLDPATPPPHPCPLPETRTNTPTPPPPLHRPPSWPRENPGEER